MRFVLGTNEFLGKPPLAALVEMISPQPLTPPECDVKGAQLLPLNVSFWRDGRLASSASAEAFRSALQLCLASWTQVPSGSLPNDDAALAVLAGLGRSKRALSQWFRVKSEVLSDWVLCSDGRLYHPQVSEQAVAIWKKEEQEQVKRERTAARTSKTRDEARRLRKALSDRGIKTHSQLSLGHLRKIAIDGGVLAPGATTLNTLVAQEASSKVLSGADAAAEGAQHSGVEPIFTRSEDIEATPTLTLFGNEFTPATRKRSEFPPANYQGFVDAYHEGMPKNPRITVLSEKRKRGIRNVWREASKLEVAPFRNYQTSEEGLAAWRKFFSVCNGSAFLRGESVQTAPGRTFCATLDFFLDIEKVIRCVEYKYHAEGE